MIPVCGQANPRPTTTGLPRKASMNASVGKTAKGKPKHYLRSRIFRRLFLSYALIIVLFVACFCAWYLHSYRVTTRSMAREACIQRANAFCTRMDRYLLVAQGLSNAMNSSESIRELYQKTYIENKTVDSLLLYRALSELKRVKASSGSLEVYTILLGFHGDNRLYTPGTVVSLGSALKLPGRLPMIGTTSAADLLSLQGETNMTLNKRFLIYADGYSGLTGSSVKGVALVLLEESALVDSLDALGDCMDGVELLRYSEPMVATGTLDGKGEILEIDSLAGSGFCYRLQISEVALAIPFPLPALLPALGTVLLGLLFMGVSYRYSQHRYAPIGAISRMVSSEDGPDPAKDEMNDILRGIADLIGERNGYREQMITISPYASQGALHQLLDGSVRDAQLEVLREGKFWELRHTWFAVGIVSLAVQSSATAIEQRCLDARALAACVCQDYAGEERAVACCPRDLRTLVVVINSEDRGDVENAFFELLRRIEEALDDPAVSVTIGVSAPRTELGSLRTACDEAERALENMLTGGRGSVYFEEQDADSDREDYAFPRDAQKRIATALRDGNEDDLNAFMDRLWEENFHKRMLSPKATRQLVDELHTALSSALRDISEQSTTHIRVERVREPATIEEIFDYYRSLLAEASRTCQDELADPARGEALEQEIREYIDANVLNPELSLSSVADHFGVSGKFVGSVCKNAYGATYLQYVRDCRIRHAARLLESTDLPLEEIALRCGFSNLLTFRRNFKALMNMNPSDFRK